MALLESVAVFLFTLWSAFSTSQGLSSTSLCQETRFNRRSLLHQIPVVLFGVVSSNVVVSPVAAAETIGKDPNCNDSACIGVWDGLLADCPHQIFSSGAGCTASQDDTPGIFSEP